MRSLKLVVFVALIVVGLVTAAPRRRCARSACRSACCPRSTGR